MSLIQFLRSGISQANRDRAAEELRDTAGDLDRPFSQFEFRRWLRGPNRVEHSMQAVEDMLSKASPLIDVIAKGREHYYQGRSFRRWSLVMVQKYGPGISPYLENAWKCLEANAEKGRQTKLGTPLDSPRVFMRKRQMIIGVATTCFLLAGVFPPWVHTLDAEGVHSRRSAGYSFIFEPPPIAAKGLSKMGDSPQPWSSMRIGDFAGMQIDTSRLLIEWACILVAAGAVWFLCEANKVRPK